MRGEGFRVGDGLCFAVVEIVVGTVEPFFVGELDLLLLSIMLHNASIDHTIYRLNIARM